jgi:uncharacterized protein involved in exopolysaccharide biosynthesis
MKLRPAQIFGLFLILLGAACFGVSAYLLTRPAEFRATARIKVLHPKIASVDSPQTAEPGASETDVEILRSEIVLQRAIDSLDLTNRWNLSAAETVRSLKRKLNVQLSPGTAFVNIAMQDQSPELAAQIANAVTEAYIAHRREAALNMAQSSVRSFTELRDDVWQKIDAAEAEANTMKTNLHVNLLTPEAQLKVPAYGAMRESMAELTNSLTKIQRNLDIASRFVEHPPEGAEIVDRADIPRRPVEKDATLPGAIAAAGLLLAVVGFLLGRRRPAA